MGKTEKSEISNLSPRLSVFGQNRALVGQISTKIDNLGTEIQSLIHNFGRTSSRRVSSRHCFTYGKGLNLRASQVLKEIASARNCICQNSYFRMGNVSFHSHTFVHEKGAQMGIKWLLPLFTIVQKRAVARPQSRIYEYKNQCGQKRLILHFRHEAAAHLHEIKDYFLAMKKKNRFRFYYSSQFGFKLVGIVISEGNPTWTL